MDYPYKTSENMFWNLEDLEFNSTSTFSPQEKSDFIKKVDFLSTLGLKNSNDSELMKEIPSFNYLKNGEE